MAINHINKSCQSIPVHIRERLRVLKEQKSTVLGGGKQFWANGARVIGVVESEGILRFQGDPAIVVDPDQPPQQQMTEAMLHG